MSWWVYLEESDGTTVEVERFEEGGTRALGGSTEAELNITYNYSAQFQRVFPSKGLSWLHGKTGEESLEALKLGVQMLGTEQFRPDYWAPTAGNAGHALAILLRWAEQYPHAVWRVS
jgi:hypothetical protein